MATLRGNTNWDQLATKFNSMNSDSGNKTVDERFFVPGKDSEGNTAAVIRFLPSPNGQAVVEESRHWFMGPTDPVSGKGEVYNEACPRSVKKKCPACVEQILQRLNFYHLVILRVGTMSNLLLVRHLP